MADRTTLLVVDDDFDTLEIVNTVAERMGIRCVVTADAKQCVSLVERLAPEVVLLDLQMPELDGIQVLRQLAAAGCSARITVMSCMDERVLTAAEVLGRRFGLSMGKAMRKPVALSALASCLARLFPARELEAVISALPNAVLAASTRPSFAGFSAA